MIDTEYFNNISQNYLKNLKENVGNYKIKIEVLSQNETVIGEIIRDISASTQGQININYQQLTRRSFNLTLINRDKLYNPSPNNFFWIDRKIKLWTGIELGDSTYWFSQGVFYCNAANTDSHTVNIEGIDKGGALDGTLKRNRLSQKVIIKAGSKVSDVFKETLLESDGLGMIDPIEPMIDGYFDTVFLQADIEVDEGDYIGTLFVEIATNYGADIYYDNDGRLRVEKNPEILGRDKYNYKGIAYNFSNESPYYESANLTYNYECYNSVTVFTNINAKDSDGNQIENVSYTAYNKNPQSPLNVSSIGIRQTDSIEIKYINGVTSAEMTELCKQNATYHLLKQSLQKMSLSFSSIPILHLNVDDVVTITDEYKNLQMEKFVISSLTIPLSGETMSISAANISYLPYDREVEW